MPGRGVEQGAIVRAGVAHRDEIGGLTVTVAPVFAEARTNGILAQTYQIWYNFVGLVFLPAPMVQLVAVLGVRFFRTATGNEPVRDWLKELNPQDRKTIGEDIKTVQFGWPLGMPLVRKMNRDLWEVRVSLHKRIARILFTVVDLEMILLHAFIKKSQSTPKRI
ncbi:hypothetical protein GCM10027093_52520 [Paraburkholderia jirisanensis]